MSTENDAKPNPEAEQAPTSAAGDNDPGLPPVAPPSGRFIIQLFLVPGLIVAVIVCVLIGVESFLGRGRSPEAYLRDLNDENPHVRWRAAADLSQELPTNEALASNVQFAIDMAKRLEKAVKDNDALARSMASRWSVTKERDRKDFEADKQFVLFLTSCQGHFLVPVGIPALTRIATADPLTAELDSAISEKERRDHFDTIEQSRRYRAVLALSLLGRNCRRFKKLPAEKQASILADLEFHAQSPDSRNDWAKSALDVLKGEGDRPISAEVVKALAKTADKSANGSDPFLRLMTAHALYFWSGPEAEGVPSVDDILEPLTRDDGRGVELLVSNSEMGERKAKQYARQIKYQAVASLAAHGSKHTEKHLPVLREMLDAEKQQEHARVENKSGQVVTTTNVAQASLLLALKAITELHAKKPELAKQLLPDVQKLAGSVGGELQVQAKELAKLLEQ